MIYKRVRGWTLGRSLPVTNFVEYPPGIQQSLQACSQGLHLVDFQDGEDPGDNNARASGRWSMDNSQNAETTVVICGVSALHSIH